MPPVDHSLSQEIEAYGALPSQVVDLGREDDPRVLRYLDLRQGEGNWRPPVVVESALVPRVIVFDGRHSTSEGDVAHWCWRATLRGDGAWVGVLEPGRLRIYRSELHDDVVRPVEEDSAERGVPLLARFLHDARSGDDDLPRRRYLLNLLHRSMTGARQHGLTPDDALSLVGRGLFWRFLVDRHLLAGLGPADVCEGASSWAACLDTKTRALRTFRWLDDTFNGGLLPFEAVPYTFPKEVFSDVLGNVAHGATPTGQLRLPSDWNEVNFAHIPVGLLSEVYEAFAHDVDAVAADDQSIHYTPRHIAEFVVSQALVAVTEPRPRVLDPAAGAGVFLVTAFRQLVEREWRQTEKRPKRKQIRRILETQLTGFDVDARALRLAELALYLTALELDPDPKPLKDLGFNALRPDILVDLSETTDGSLAPVRETFAAKFDLVVGNPPWTATRLAPGGKKRWVSATFALVKARLGADAAKTFDFPDTNPDLPFVWRSMEWAKPGGQIALALHARWLFGLSPRTVRVRADLLAALQVTGVLNGSALRRTGVWPNNDAPFCFLFAANRLAPKEATFHFVSPQLDADAESAQTRLRIDWIDAEAVPVAEVLDEPWALKSRFRGDRLARRALAAMRSRGGPLGEYLKSLNTKLENGYQVGRTTRAHPLAAKMGDLLDVKGEKKLGFIVDGTHLRRFSRGSALYRPKKPETYQAPLLIVRRAIPASRLVPCSHLSLVNVAFDSTLSGISMQGRADAVEVLKYLQLVFQSSAYVFHELLVDPQYGMFVDAVYLESVQRLPIIPYEQVSGALRSRAIELWAYAARGIDEQLAASIDDFVFDLFDLDAIERQAVRDTLATRGPSTRAKRRAVSPPTEKERQSFVDALRESLDDVLSASDLTTQVRELDALAKTPWRVIRIDISRGPASPDASLPLEAFLSEADEGGASLVIVRASETTWFVGLLARYALWTPSRARLLATDLIAERSSDG